MRVGADPVLALAADVRRQSECEHRFAVGQRAMVLQTEMALLTDSGVGSTKQQLDLNIAWFESIELYRDLYADAVAKRNAMPRRPDPAQLDTFPGGADTRLPCRNAACLGKLVIAVAGP